MIKVVWKERKNTTTRGICKVESCIPTGFQFLAVGIQSELQQHELFSPRCGGTSSPVSLHQIRAWEDCCGTLFSVPTFIILSKVSFEVVICPSILNPSLSIRVLIEFLSPYSPSGYTFVFVTPQVGPSLHMVLTKVYIVEIPEASGPCTSSFFLFKCPVIIYIYPHIFLSFLWSFHW